MYTLISKNVNLNHICKIIKKNKLKTINILK